MRNWRHWSDDLEVIRVVEEENGRPAVQVRENSQGTMRNVTTAEDGELVHDEWTLYGAMRKLAKEANKAENDLEKVREDYSEVKAALTRVNGLYRQERENRTHAENEAQDLRRKLSNAVGVIDRVERGQSQILAEWAVYDLNRILREHGRRTSGTPKTVEDIPEFLRGTFAEAANNGNKIRAIKAVRTLTGAGLKEAKDAVEWLEKKAS